MATSQGSGTWESWLCICVPCPWRYSQWTHCISWNPCLEQGPWKRILLTFQPLSLEPVGLCFPVHYYPCFSVYSWKQLVTALWVPAHLSRRLPRPPFEGQMPREPGVGVEVVCRIVGYKIQNLTVWFAAKAQLDYVKKGKGATCISCFFTAQANLNIAYYHNLSRVKIAQNKWQVAGNEALCQEMAKGWENRLWARS